MRWTGSTCICSARRAGALLARKDQDRGRYRHRCAGFLDQCCQRLCGSQRIPYDGIDQNRYVARTFIQPTQQLRDRGVRMKLSAIRSIVEGKRIILIDDRSRGDDIPAHRSAVAGSGA
ncbi:MAG: hypothetical protein ACLVJ6_00475 [Merdibacter sp.]